MRMHLGLLFFLTLPLSAQAWDPPREEEPPKKSAPKTILDTTEDVLENTVEKIAEVADDTRQRRTDAKAMALAEYSLIDSLVLRKYGISGGMILSPDLTVEVEYLVGNTSVPMDLLRLTNLKDERISIIGRSYFGTNSFNLSYGLSYIRLNTTLSLDELSPNSPQNNQLFGVQTLGVHVGVGHRWIYRNKITLGVDWLSIAQPLFILNRDDAVLASLATYSIVDESIKIFSHLPRISFLKVQLGATF